MKTHFLHLSNGWVELCSRPDRVQFTFTIAAAASLFMIIMVTRETYELCARSLWMMDSWGERVSAIVANKL